MIYKFNAYGHPNILAAHKTTLEFTKDNELTLNGDCIVGVKADFDFGKIKEFIKNSKNKKISIIIKTPDGKYLEEINAELNPKFNSDREMVIRKTDFISERTFAVRADKAALELDRRLIGVLKQENKVIISIYFI